MLTVLVGGLLGLFGTILGAGLTTWTTRQTAERLDRLARLEVRRQEYRAGVSRFVTALLDYRISEMDRWHARHSGWKDEKTAAVDVYRTRAACWNALFQLRLSTDSEDLVRLARQGIDRTYSIRESESAHEMNERADEVREDLASVIAVARRDEPGGNTSTP
jgi:hypothetical protein